MHKMCATRRTTHVRAPRASALTPMVHHNWNGLFSYYTPILLLLQHCFPTSSRLDFPVLRFCNGSGSTFGRLIVAGAASASGQQARARGKAYSLLHKTRTSPILFTRISVERAGVHLFHHFYFDVIGAIFPQFAGVWLWVRRDRLKGGLAVYCSA
jgi:hypothetical protein